MCSAAAPRVLARWQYQGISRGESVSTRNVTMVNVGTWPIYQARSISGMVYQSYSFWLGSELLQWLMPESVYQKFWTEEAAQPRSLLHAAQKMIKWQ